MKKQLAICALLALSGCDSSSSFTPDGGVGSFDITFYGYENKGRYSDHCIESVYVATHSTDGSIIKSWEVEGSVATIVNDASSAYFSIAYRDIADNKQYQQSFEIDLVDRDVLFNFNTSDECLVNSSLSAEEYLIHADVLSDYTRVLPHGYSEGSSRHTYEVSLYDGEEFSILALDEETNHFGVAYSSGSDVSIVVDSPMNVLSVTSENTPDQEFRSDLSWMPKKGVPLLEDIWAYWFNPDYDLSTGQQHTFYYPNEAGTLIVNSSWTTRYLTNYSNLTKHEIHQKVRLPFDVESVPEFLSIEAGEQHYESQVITRFRGYLPEGEVQRNGHNVIFQTEMDRGQSADSLVEIELIAEVMVPMDGDYLCTDISYKIGGPDLLGIELIGIASNAQLLPHPKTRPSPSELSLIKGELFSKQLFMSEEEREYEYESVRCH